MADRPRPDPFSAPSAPAVSISGLDDSHPDGARYRTGALLGQGGMGRVWVAEDRVLKRTVALKELSPELRDHAGARARLAREAWITAHLDHPGIVAVHDAGTLDQGTPFYTMRLVRGRTLAQALREAADPAERMKVLRPLLAACEAVAYAHASGVVHRDLKPENIMIGGFGEVQVVDWGLAIPFGEACEAWVRAGMEVESSDRLVGTPAWMSPEQAAGGEVGPPSDVFSLGAILHSILDGEPPYGTVPSDQQVAARLLGPPPPPRGARLPAELVAIARRATAMDPGDRYPTASELAQDLENWFEGRRVAAHLYSPREVLVGFLRVWRVPLTISAAGLVAIGAAVGVGWARTATERDRAREAEEAAVSARADAERHLASALGRQAVDAVIRDDRDAAETLAFRALSLAEDPLARGALAAFARAPRPRVLRAVPLPACEAMTFVQADVVCVESNTVSRWTPGDAAPRWRVALDAAQVAAVTPDGPIAARTRSGGVVRIDANTGTFAASLPVANAAPWITPGDGSPRGALPVCEGRRAAGVGSSAEHLGVACADGTLSVTRGSEVVFRVSTTYNDDQEVSALVVRSDGGLIVGTLRGLVAEVSPEGRIERTSSTSLGMIRGLAPSPGGGLLAISGASEGVHLVRTPPEGAATWIAAIQAESGATFRWAAADQLEIAGAQLQTFQIDRRAGASRVQHGGGVSDIAVDGARLAVAVPERLEIIDPDAGTVRSVPILPYLTKAAAWIPGTESLVAASVSVPHIVRVEGGVARPIPGVPVEPVRRLVAFRDGTFAWATPGTALRVVGPDNTYQTIFRIQGFADLESDPGRRRALALEQDGTVAILVDGVYTPQFGAPGARAAALLEDGRIVLGFADEVQLRSAAGEVVRAWAAPGASIRDVDVHPQLGLVAAGGTDGRVRIWHLDRDELVAELVGHKERVAAVAFGPEWLATGSWDHTTRLWDLGVMLADREALARPGAVKLP